MLFVRLPHATKVCLLASIEVNSRHQIQAYRLVAEIRQLPKPLQSKRLGLRSLVNHLESMTFFDRICDIIDSK